MEAFSGTPEEFDAFLEGARLVLWDKLIADAGIEKQWAGPGCRI